MVDAFFVRTEPDSSIVKPAHIHITSAPQIRNEKVLKTNIVSSSTPAACAISGRKNMQATDTSSSAASVGYLYRV